MTLEMLTDVGSTPHSGDSNPSGFVQVGDLTYFSTRPSAYDPQHTWVTNGAMNATRLLSEVLPGNLLVGGVVGNVAGTLYFTASLPDLTGYKLWQWGGIGSEPSQVLSATGQSLSIATPIVEVGGVWYFGALATSVGVGTELWRTDGTQTGTYQVKEIRPGPMGGFNQPNVGHQPTLFNVGGRLMFIANDGTHGSELWTSDGTEAGTFMVKDVFAGSSSGVYGGSFSGRIAEVVGDVLYFSATDQPYSTELWRSDGTTAGTYQVKDIRLGIQPSSPQHLTNVDGTLYFVANDGATGNELWKSDGTEAGTVLVKNIESDMTAPGPFDLTEMNGVLYFGAGNALWRSDGTEAGTSQVFGDQPFPNFIPLPTPLPSLNETYANLDQIVNLNGTLYFPGRDASGPQSFALWKYEGVGNATRVLSRSAAGINYSNTFETIHFLTAAGDKLYFAGDTSNHGNEPWVSDGTTAGTRLLKDVTGMSSSSGVGRLTNLNGVLLFPANTGVHPVAPPRGWWSTDGTVAGTTSYIPSSIPLNYYQQIGTSGGLAFYKLQGSTSLDWELWRTDGTSEGTFRVKSMRPSTEWKPSAISSYSVEMNGDLYFIASDVIHGLELWRSNGIETGTKLVADINPSDADGVTSVTMANVNGTLYFVANDGASGNALWKTDGTAAGTSLVRTFVSWMPTNLYNGNGTLYFGAGDAEYGFELWKSDGTTAGTVMVRDISPGNSLWQSDPPGFANIGDTIYFGANDGITGLELWKSDGTAEGTMLVKDIRPAGSGLSFHSRQFAVVGSTLYFYANDGVHGSELWKSDGTTAGTTLVKDIRLGSSASDIGVIANPVNVGGILYFGASDGVNGAELWRSDGTEAGTYMVRNINAVFGGLGGSDPNSLTNVNGRLYFTANDGTHGTELWVMSPDPVAMAAGDYDQNGVTDGADFLRWQRAFGSRDATDDGDSDGVVGLGDLEAWKHSFGTPVSTAAASGFAALLAEEEKEEVATPAFGGDERRAAFRETAARDALFAAGDLSHFFASGDEVADRFWRRKREIRGR